MPPDHNWVLETNNRIRQLSILGPNWDSYDANEITSKALDSARRLVGLLFVASHVLERRPHIVPLVDGGLQLEWHHNGYDVEIEINPEGETSGWMRHENYEWKTTG